MSTDAPPQPPAQDPWDSVELDPFDTNDDSIKAAALFTITNAILSEREPCRTSLPGRIYVQELLDSAHPRRVFEVLRMSLGTFYALRDWLLANTSLRSSRKQEGVSIEEKLVIFLHITVRGATNRDCQERFAYSGETITR